jgi:hypothetical protein
MANPFYNVSGNPATGSEGLSTLMRGEFLSIQAAFEVMPRITTTGLFDTVFNQLGSFTFTLPSAPGMIALTADVAAETSRATAAEAVNAAAITAETTRAGAAESVNAAAISAETTARTAAVAGEASRATAAEAVNAAAITAEATARAAGDAAEVTARNAAITVETNRAAAAEAANATAITAEATARANGDTAEANARVAGIAAEANRANAALAPYATWAATSAAIAATYQPLSPSAPYVKNTFGTNAISLGFLGGQLVAAVDTTGFGQVPTQVAPGNFPRNGDNASFANLNATGNLTASGPVYAGAAVTNFALFMAGDVANRFINWTNDGWKFVYNTAAGTLTQFNNIGQSRFSVDAGGNLFVPGTVTASNVSDFRTKRNVTPYRRGLEAIIALQPVSYEYNGTGGTTDTGKTRWGVIAQQALPYLPECVYPTPEPASDPTREDEAVKMRFSGQLSFDEQPLLYAMINAFQDVVAELQAAKARLSALEAR